MLALLKEWAAARGDDPDAVVLKPWQHRDLRRTARTMMARMGVDSKIGEHALGHALPGVEGIYDRHHYLTEKREAFEKLAEYCRAHRQPAGRQRGAAVCPLRMQRSASILSNDGLDANLSQCDEQSC